MDSIGGPTERPRRALAWFLAGLAVVFTTMVAGGTWLKASVASRTAGAARSSAITPSAPGWAPATAAGRPGPSPIAAVPYTFPVRGLVTYSREHHDYPATDVMAACDATVVAVTDAVVLEISRVDHYDAAVDDGATRGGLFVSLLGDDGVRYYGSHLGSVVAHLGVGSRVAAGQALGIVGDTGRAGACHLHFGISPPCARVGDWWIRRGVVWPWSYLDSWRNGGAASPVAQVAAYVADHGCPAAPR